MKLLGGLDRFLLTSSLSHEHQPLAVQLIRLTLLLLVLSATWYGVRRSELERAASEARSRNLETRFEALIDEATNTLFERAERAQEAAVGALRSSFCGLEAQAASADLAAAAATT
jgi:hypothetical protein